MSPMPTDLEQRFEELYTELRDLAGHVWRGNPSRTLTRTALLNEAFLRLARSSGVSPKDDLHFKRIAASAMRRVLIDAARRRQSLKRGEGWVEVPASDVAQPDELGLDGLVALHRAIDKLAVGSRRAASLVELRFFGGLEVGEAAAVLGISAAQAGRDWRAAKAWLEAELQDPVGGLDPE